MSWITTDWKLKLLGLGLAVLLLLGVAYSQYPIQTVTVDARINYNGLPPTGLIVNNPPATTRVSISGLASDLRAATATVDVDLSKVKQGTAVVVTPTPHTTGQNVNPVSVTPVTLKIEQLVTASLDIQVRAIFANGWEVSSKAPQAICGNGSASAPPCQVSVSGPASLLQGLAAYVLVADPISSKSRDLPNIPVRFSRNGSDVDLTKLAAIPALTWEPPAVTAHIEAQQGTETIQVALVNALPSAPPPAGYHVVGVVINPLLITLTGSPDLLAGINSITLAAQSLAGYTTDHTFTIKIVGPDPSVVLSQKTATVTYVIRPDASVSPSP